MASDPPIVPRARTEGSPIRPASEDIAGKLVASSRCTVAWVVAPPIQRSLPSSRTPFISPIAVRQTTLDGMASRCFIVGISVWPPE